MKKRKRLNWIACILAASTGGTPPVSNTRITQASDTRVTMAGDTRITQ